MTEDVVIQLRNGRSKVIRWLTVDGRLLVEKDLAQKDGVRVGRAALAYASATCVGASLDASCGINCAYCAEAKFVYCGYCFFCAGPKASNCGGA
jgi:hypothetical protein